MADLISPNKTHVMRSYEGWAYCARTPDRSIFHGVFRKGLPAQPGPRRAAEQRRIGHEWFDPRKAARGRTRATAGTLRPA